MKIDPNTRISILLMIILGFSLITYCFGFSIMIANRQTELYLTKYESFLNEFNKFTIKGELLNPLIKNINDAKDFVPLINKDVTSTFVSGTLSLIMFFLLYITQKKSHNFEITKIKLFLENHKITYPLFTTLIFSVGIAFYFSTSDIELSAYQTTSEILSTMEPFTQTRFEMDSETSEQIVKETVVGKMSLIVLYMQQNLASMHSSLLNQTYFFGLFLFLIVGLILSKFSFFYQSFFITASVGIMFWIVNALTLNTTFF